MGRPRRIFIARQGFKVAFCGAIGCDSSALDIIRELRHLKVDTRFLIKKKEKHTNQSIIVSADGQDRTILVYRGASDILSEKDIDWRKIKHSAWFYLAPFTGLLCNSFGKIIDFAKENKIKVAVNPSKEQLSLPNGQLKSILQKVDILFLNEEEAALLEKPPFELCPGVVVITKGAEGVEVHDKNNVYSALPNPNRKIVDTTGAGDSFSSGFLSDFIKYNGDIEKAIQLGMANSAANLAVMGAKDGILDKNSNYEKVKVLSSKS